ncbi:MAG: AIPR family protein [Planctomycetes bacterium]|nr:AIPR family protein [Planctomycetota bacterium]
MNINASIIDQRLAAVLDEIRERASAELRVTREDLLHSLAFIYLCVKTMLDLDADETFDCLTEGGGDFGVDALHLSEEIDGEFVVTLFQGKYHRDLEAKSNFEETGINALINAIRHIFDPASQLGQINDRLKAKVEEVRSLIRDGYIPRVRALACNNGLKWNAAAQEAIDRTGFGDQVIWEHVNHDVLIGILQRIKPVDETLRLTGKAIIEDMNFSRICIGRIPVSEIANLLKNHGERLLERNIRRYLGLQGNRVNESIQQTLTGDHPDNFYFFNNGLTLVCNDFSYNALQNSDYQVKVENLQIVNGGQTCMTIFKTLEKMEPNRISKDASVLVRLYKLPKDNQDIVMQITFATNSQNPVDLKDLKANDQKQRLLEESIAALRYAYRRKRTDAAVKTSDITSGTAAEAILAVWRNKPHQAKFFSREHFGKLYETIFTNDLNGAQTIIAVLLYRIAENRRRRPDDNDPEFVRYASCFIAMQMGRRLLRDLGVSLAGLNHRNFAQAVNLVEQNGIAYFNKSLPDVKSALESLYGNAEISLQQLSATFRRGDLIQILLEIN